jgi:hypothetical protein
MLKFTPKNASPTANFYNRWHQTRPGPTPLKAFFRTDDHCRTDPEIMLSEELSDIEKLDRMHALIPLEACKIDNLNKATPAQLKQLKDGLAVTEASIYHV